MRRVVIERRPAGKGNEPDYLREVLRACYALEDTLGVRRRGRVVTEAQGVPLGKGRIPRLSAGASREAVRRWLRGEVVAEAQTAPAPRAGEIPRLTAGHSREAVLAWWRRL